MDIPATTPPAWQVVLRWIAVLPGALLASCLGTFAARLFNFLTSSRFGDDSWYWYIISQGLLGGLSGWAFVWASMAIAPRFKRHVGWVMAIIAVLICAVLLYPTISKHDWMGAWGVLATAIGGVVAARDDNDQA